MVEVFCSERKIARGSRIGCQYGKGGEADLMKTVILLCLSNVFMTFAWYAHLKNLRDKPLMVAILVSWGIAFFEYTLQVPANRVGYGQFSLAQLKVMQEIITMCVFAGFAVLYMRHSLKMDFLWASSCLVGAAYFMFRR
jgi:uncharacterized protein (DUF486 family)